MKTCCGVSGMHVYSRECAKGKRVRGGGGGGRQCEGKDGVAMPVMLCTRFCYLGGREYCGKKQAWFMWSHVSSQQLECLRYPIEACSSLSVMHVYSRACAELKRVQLRWGGSMKGGPRLQCRCLFPGILCKALRVRRNYGLDRW